MIRKKAGRFRRKRLTSADFSDNDLRLLAVTGALAGAVKSIIDTPILTKDGAISTESQKTYDAVVSKLPEFEDEVSTVKTLNFGNIPFSDTVCTLEKGSEQSTIQQTETENNRILYIIRWIGAVILFILGTIMLFYREIPIAAVWIALGLNVCPKTYHRVRKFDRWFIALIIWLFGISCLFSGMILLAIILSIVGLNICPATASKTILKEKEIWEKFKGNLK